MGAGPPYGNKNAEKWSLRKSVQLFKDAIKLTDEKETFHLLKNDKPIEVTGYKFDFIGEVARELGTFHQIFDHLVKRFPTLQRLKHQLNNNIEQNCYFNTKKGIIREATGIVNLKSNWKWTDRTNNESNVNLNTPININVIGNDDDFPDNEEDIDITR